MNNVHRRRRGVTREQVIVQIAAEIRALRLPHTVRVGLDGPDAAGKTTLAGEIARAVGRTTIRIGLDGFHQPAAIRKQRGVLDPEGYYRDSFDNALIVRSVLRPLGPGGDGRYVEATFDYRTDRTIVHEPMLANPGSVLICDGVFLLRPELREHWDFTVYVHVDPEESIRRALVRDRERFGSAAEVELHYRERYMPGQELYRQEADPVGRADVVLDNNDLAGPVRLA